MSVICVQYGQCGNQVGQELFSTVYEDIKSNTDRARNSYNLQAMNRWFSATSSGKWLPRAILVDTEPKVVESCHHKAFNYKHVVAKSTGGSANNWAFGYSCKSKLLQKEVLDAVQTEAEKSDFVTDILNIYSSSGGTGAGVGSKIIEEIRDLYPNKPLVNVIILPYCKGEIVTQGYNSVLSLAKLYSVADSMILFENDNLHYICNNSLGVKSVTFSCMNNIIAQQISAIYQPIQEDSTMDLLSGLTAHPSYKFLLVKSAPHILKENMQYESARHWKSLTESLYKQCRYEYQQQKASQTKLRTKYISSVVISRGLEKSDDLEIKGFTNSASYVGWLPAQERCRYLHESNVFNNIDKYVTLVSNNNSVYMPVNLIVEDAWNLFSYGAYLHHYKKYGVDKDFFLESFQTLENILYDYKSL